MWSFSVTSSRNNERSADPDTMATFLSVGYPTVTLEDFHEKPPLLQSSLIYIIYILKPSFTGL